jgi:hypothetical protein
VHNVVLLACGLGIVSAVRIADELLQDSESAVSRITLIYYTCGSGCRSTVPTACAGGILADRVDFFGYVAERGTSLVGSLYAFERSTREHHPARAVTIAALGGNRIVVCTR